MGSSEGSVKAERSSVSRAGIKIGRDQYRPLLSKPSAEHWKRIGLRRRGGVATPLFSIYSGRSIGIGELPDLKLLVDWCRASGLSVIQLLPLNDVGFHFRPYDAESAFALDPMYLSLEDLQGVPVESFRSAVQTLRARFPTGGSRVNYAVKEAKLDLLWKMFQARSGAGSDLFEHFQSENRFWLRDYALFKVLKEKNREAGWESWPLAFKRRETRALRAFEREHEQRVEFHEWLQWQLFEQLRAVKCCAADSDVLLAGDLSFLVSRDSSDVWSHPRYFRLDVAAGAPPDRYFAKGQRWGMPPYDWDQAAEGNDEHLREKLKYAEHFYDLFRIDHAVGLFRIWTIPLDEPPEHFGLHGAFDPPDERLWLDRGRRLFSLILDATRMLPCAEDLGVIPECTFQVLDELGVPGIDVQRWTRDWAKTYDFKPPQAYRPISFAVLSNHDMASFGGWWRFEAGTVDGALFERKCKAAGVSFEKVRDKLFNLERSRYGRLRWKAELRSVPEVLKRLGLNGNAAEDVAELFLESFDEQNKFWSYLEMGGTVETLKDDETVRLTLLRKALAKAAGTASIFHVQLLSDWLSLDPGFTVDPWQFRINFPGVMSDRNWSLVMPLSLEEMLGLGINSEIRRMNQAAGRLNFPPPAQ